MKRLVLLLVLSAVLCSGCGIAALTPVIVFDEPELTIYQIASALTGCPESILRGIAFAESTYNPDAIGDDGISIGLCQINETFHAERVKRYGEYNPLCPLDSLMIAGRLYMDNLKTLKSQRLAITAHKTGLTGAKRGEVTWYVERVLKGSKG
jgi:soluble lytic murein transglycosylase-like protein